MVVREEACVIIESVSQTKHVHFKTTKSATCLCLKSSSLLLFIMHTLYSRINNTSALLSSCVMGLLAAIALSSMMLQFFEAPLEGGSVVVNGVKV